MKILIVVFQVLLLILLAPLVSGVIRKIKNNLRMRQGAGILQPYYNLFKLFGKEEVVSVNASWIFYAAPYIVFSSSVAALFIVPVFVPQISFGSLGDFLAVIFLLSLGRFFLALAALDTGSAFGGMGSSREMFIASVVEPVAVLAVFAVSLAGGSTSLVSVNTYDGMFMARLFACVSLLFVLIAETSRFPIDNQETHLELTMIHEAMLLEYSGRSLGIIELANHVKQIMFFVLVSGVLLPCGYLASSGGLFIAGAVVIKIAALCVLVGVLDISMAKLRLFRVVDFLGVGFVFAGLAFIFALMRI